MTARNPSRVGVLGFAACTPLGYTLEPSLAAMGANLNNITTSPARALGGEFASASCLVDPLLPREERLAQLLTHGLADLQSLLDLHGLDRAPILLGLPKDLGTSTLNRIDAVQAEAGFPCEEGARFEYGRASGFAALASAMQMITRRSHRCVIVGGVDSLCAPDTVASLARERRLLEPFTEGTIPGEAAAFLVLLHPDDPALDPSQALWIETVAVARGRAFTDATAVDAKALTHVLHHAQLNSASDLGKSSSRVHRVIAAHSGEGYFARSFSMAYLRAAHLMPEPLVVTLTADRVGDVGAAAGPLGLAFAAYWMAKECRDQKGTRRTLVYSESDGGEVGAAILCGQPRSWQRVAEAKRS